MGHAAVKIAVSLPADLYRVIERVRKIVGKSRSAIVQDALALWAARAAREKVITRYQEGYRRHPESAAEITAAEAAAVQLLAREPWK